MSIRILVVDDNRDALSMYVKILLLRAKPKECSSTKIGNEHFLEVEDADTVSLALEKLATKQFDILVVDLKIPSSSKEEMGGLEIISQSMRLDPLRPIIAITGYGTVELARKAITRGVFDFIEKSGNAADEIIDSVQRAISYRDEKLLRSGNPFTPMTGIEPTVFGGRTTEIDFFEQRLYRALHSRTYEHFLVLGSWGIGKSTLLKEYKKICQSQGNIACIVPLELLPDGITLNEAAKSIVEGIVRELPFPIQRFKKITEFFNSVGINVLGTGLEFSRNTSKTEISAQAFLHDALINLWKDIENKTGILVILLDDLDNFSAMPEIVMTLKQTLSMDSIRETKILVGMASTPTNWLELTAISKHHPLSRYFISRVELSLLNENELREIIFKSLSRTGVSFNPEVVSRVFEYTNGHPFEMQLLCYNLFNNQLSRRVEVSVWDKAIQSTLNDLGLAIFDHWFNQASIEEKKVLCAIANAETPLSYKSIYELAETGKLEVSKKGISKYLQRLVEKKLISKSGRGVYILMDRMFRAYICSHSH